MSEIDDWRREEWGEPPKEVRLTIRSELLADAEAARRWLREVGGEGWVCTVDAVLPAQDVPADAIPLQADLRVSSSEGACLRFDGGWQAWRYVEGDGESCLAFDETRVTHDGRGVWRVYWKQVEQHQVKVWRPFASRLLEVS